MYTFKNRMPDNFICGKCGKVAKTKQALERHAAYHEDDRPFSCEVCLQRFKNSDDRGKHYRRLRKDGKFPIACTVCHKHFKTDDILKKHIEMLGCNVAVVEVKKSENVDTNVNTNIEGSAITPKEEFISADGITCTCKICETEFVSTACLKKHYKEIHNDNKRQVCIQCGQTLSSKDSLARHFSIFHQTSFPYSCDLCDQKFKIKESLCRHVKFVHQDGGYQCPECHRVFSQPVNLRKHLAVHSTQKEFVCKSCGREFRWKQALQKHELLHEVQANSNRTDKTVNNVSSFITDSDLTTGKSDESHDDDDEYDNIVEEVCDDNIQETSMISEKQCTEKESVTSNLNIGCFDKYSSKKAPKIAQCSQSDHFDFENGSLLSSRKGNTTVSKEGDEYDFPDEEDVLDRGSSNSFKQVACRKRIDTFTDTEWNETKKLKLANYTENKNKSIEENVDNDVELNASIEQKDLDKFNKRLVLRNSTLCENSDDESELLDSTNSTNHKTKCTEECRKDISDNINGSECDSVLEQRIENIGCDARLQKMTYSALTSFPTDKTKDAPRLVFKPSSISNIMAGPDMPRRSPNNCADGKGDHENQHPSRKLMFRFPPATYGSLHTKLHNPFLIPNNSNAHLLSVGKTYSKIDEEITASKSAQDTSTLAIAPPDQIIPSGKFSLVKHMLSLQNEDNFDKTLFENPLYNKPADVKDFEQMVERHRVTDKSDDSVVQSYDLSAKQNIPFHWLGMSIANRKKSFRECDIKKDTERNDSERVKTINTEHKECQNDKIDSKNNASSGIYSSKEYSEKTAGFKSTDYSQTANGKDSEHEKSNTYPQAQTHRGFQAMKNLVAAQKSNSEYKSPAAKSVLTNPFDYENKSFQDTASNLSRSHKDTTTVEVHSHITSQIKVRTSENTEAVAGAADQNKQMFNLNRTAGQDICHSESNSSKLVYFNRHHSVDTFSSSPLTTSFSYPKHSVQLPRAYSGKSVSSDTVTSTIQFLRSQSIPCSLAYSSHIQQQRTWGSDSSINTESCLDNTLNERRMYHSTADSIPSLAFAAGGRSEKEARFPHEKVAFNRGSDCTSEGIGNEPGTERRTGIPPHTEIDLTMISKNFAQLQKLNQGSLERNELRRVVRDQNIRENLNRNELEYHQMQVNDGPSPYRSNRPEGQRVSSTYVPINQKVSNDVDTDERCTFDAYNLIHSPFRANMSRLSDTLNHDRDSESGRSALKSSPQVRSDSVPFEKTHMVTNNDRDYVTAGIERRNVSLFERERRVNDAERRSTSYNDEKKKSEVSIFDMLNGQEEKWKEFENIETLLGSYI